MQQAGPELYTGRVARRRAADYYRRHETEGA
jgi:hypothetical protein